MAFFSIFGNFVDAECPIWARGPEVGSRAPNENAGVFRKLLDLPWRYFIVLVGRKLAHLRNIFLAAIKVLFWSFGPLESENVT